MDYLPFPMLVALILPILVLPILALPISGSSYSGYPHVSHAYSSAVRTHTFMAVYSMRPQVLDDEDIQWPTRNSGPAGPVFVAVITSRNTPYVS